MGKNIKGLDALHQVMKGDMTIDQACEDMTDDFEIGHVSHRADGDWKKVAQGKWVPVKAGGDKSQETVNKQDQIDMMHTVSEYFDEESETNPNLSDKPTLAKIYRAIKEGKDTSKFNQRDVDGLKSWMGMGDKDEPEGDEEPLSDNVGIRDLQKRGYDLTKLELRPDADGNWGVYNKGSGYGLGITIAGKILDEETAKKAGLTVKGGGAEGAKPAGQNGAKKEDGAPLREGEKKPDSQGDKNVLTSSNDVTFEHVNQVAKKVQKLMRAPTALEMMEKFSITQIQKMVNAGGADLGNGGVKEYLKKKASLPGGVNLDEAAKDIAKGEERRIARNIWDRYERKELDVDDNGYFQIAESARPQAEGGKRQLKRRADGTIIYETPDDVIYDMVENYNELDRGDLQGVIEAAAMSHGWDENEILEEVDRQAAEKYNLGVDSAAPRLTRDTKIRLSRIKRG